MPLQKDYVTPSTGATASYHVAQLVTLDAIGASTSVSVYSYLSAAARADGRAPMYTQQIVVNELPGAGQDAFAFAEAKLVEAPPDDATPPVYAGRYLFAGAQIVD